MLLPPSTREEVDHREQLWNNNRSIEEAFEERHTYNYTSPENHLSYCQKNFNKRGVFDETESIQSERLLRVAYVLKKSGYEIFTRNDFYVMNVLYGTCYIYNRYVSRNTTTPTGSDFLEPGSDEDNLVFVSSFFLSLCTWYYDDVDSLVHDVLSGDTIRTSYCKPSLRDVKEEAIRIFTRLRGDIMVPVHANEHFDGQNEEMRIIYCALMLIFMSYPLLMSLRPSLVGLAMCKLVYLLEFPPTASSSNSTSMDDEDDQADGGGGAIKKRDIDIVMHIIIHHVAHVSPDISDIEPHSSLGGIISMVIQLASERPLSKFKVYGGGVSSRHRHNRGGGGGGGGQPVLDIEAAIIERNHSYAINKSISVKKYVSVHKVSTGEQKDLPYIIKMFKLHNEEEDEEKTTIKNGDDECGGLVHFQYIAREIALVKFLQQTSDLIEPVLGMRGGTKFIYMFMGGDSISMTEFLKRPECHFMKDDMCRNIAIDICNAVAHCHRHDIIHHDIKPDNFVMSKKDGRVRLIDFGLSEPRFSHSVTHSLIVQPLTYRAPELLLGYTRYTEAVDLWAMGCVIYELASVEKKQAIAIKERDDPGLLKKCDETSISNRVLMLRIITQRLSTNPVATSYHSSSRHGNIFPGRDAKEHETLSSYPLWGQVCQRDILTEPLQCHYEPMDITRKVSCAPVQHILRSLFSLIPSRRVSASNAAIYISQY